MAEFRRLGDDDFETDGLPKQSRFGSLEMRFTESKVFGNPGPHWLARYHKLPAYMGNGSTPTLAAASLQELLREAPLYFVEVTRVDGPKTLRRLVPRLLAAQFAAAELGNSKRSDFVVDPIAERYKVRKADILRTATIWRNHPSTAPTFVPLVAAGQIFAAEKSGDLPALKTPANVGTTLSSTSTSTSTMLSNDVADLMFKQRDIWEWEAIFARKKLPTSAI